eukprot:GHVR01054094.1.p1 GENE.GHVR01054094.1~~GHVR01054094.1.p1  ORF type:complete len:405 (+),score=38.18 GHVR01054094.1:25-1239(+)
MSSTELLDTVPVRHTWRDRTFSPVNAGSIRGSIINLVATALGCGLITVSSCFATMGLLLCIFSMFLCALMSCISACVLMSAMTETSAKSYSDLLVKVIGVKWGVIFDFIIVSYCTGIIVAYFFACAEFTIPIVHHYGLPTICEYPPLIVFILILCLILPTSMEKLNAIMSMYSLVPIVFMVIGVAIYVPIVRTEAASKTFQWIDFNWNFFKANSVILFAFNQHTNVSLVAEELQNPTDTRIFKINSRAHLIEFLAYMSVGLLGYFTFYANTEVNILNNYSSDSLFWNFNRLFLMLSLAVSIPINGITMVRSMQLFVRGVIDLKYKNPLNTPNTTHEIEDEPQNIRELRAFTDKKAFRVTVVICSFSIAQLVSFFTTDLGTVIGVVSSLLATTIMVTFPGYLNRH